MRVGLNLLHLIPGKLGGLETYAVNLLDDLRRTSGLEIFILCATKYAGYFAPWARDFTVVPLDVAVDSTPRRILHEQLFLAREVRRLRLDVLHSSGYTAPVSVPCRKVMTVHDLNYLEIPDLIRRSHGELRYRLIRWLGPRSMRAADQLITVSAHVGRRAQALCGIAAERIHPILNHPAADMRAIVAEPPPAAAALQAEPFLLYVASWYPHKNHATLFAALSALQARTGRTPRLVLAGLHLKNDEQRGELQAQLGAAGLTDRTHVVAAHLSVAQLAWLYREARCFVFPSRFEGFGIPILEAMSAGTPVLCADRMPMTEVAGGATRLFDPEDAAQLSALIGACWDDEAELARLAAAGRARYEELCAEARRVPQRLEAVYRAALAS